MCVELPKRFPPVVRCAFTEDTGDQCRLVANHHGAHRFTTTAKRERATMQKGSKTAKK